MESISLPGFPGHSLTLSKVWRIHQLTHISVPLFSFSFFPLIFCILYIVPLFYSSFSPSSWLQKPASPLCCMGRCVGAAIKFRDEGWCCFVKCTTMLFRYLTDPHRYTHQVTQMFSAGFPGSECSKHSLSFPAKTWHLKILKVFCRSWCHPFP